MEASRGRKGRKARWQLSLGFKEVIFAGLGVLGLVMMSFALGTLAGRGDIYRVFYNWGLLSPEVSQNAHFLAPAAPRTATSTFTPGASATTAAAPAPLPTTAPLPDTASAKPAPAPLTGSIAPVTPDSPPQKKSKGGSSLHREQKAKEEELRKVRQEVASKLKFQNSFDTSPKAPRQAQEAKEKAGAGKPQPTKVKVAQFRDRKAAKAKLAELKKKGVQASLKEGKDEKGPLYTVYKQAPPATPDADRVAQKPQKTDDKKAKTAE
ncbi:MAG: hypothetical protein Q8M54_09130 [Desulfobaccales bacterium]|nr:hypothetical protein [Desulfobaccales bacterium]